MKTLKFLHVCFAMMWMGALGSMWALAFIPTDNAAELCMAMKSLIWVDEHMLIPGAVSILVTGVIYGLFTNYGFFKYRWITVKWILTLTLVIVGTFLFHPKALTAIDILDHQGDIAMASSQVVDAIAWCKMSGIQFATIVVIVMLSVFRPWKKNNKSAV